MKADIIRSLQKSLKVKRSMARRAAGDDARDRRDWAAAEREYHAHLTRMPEDQAIWVQYGHSLKEQGKRKEAEAAYRRAIELRPDDPDAHLQMGHVLKLLGKSEEAQGAYVSSMELKPSRSAFEELESLDMVQLPRGRHRASAEASADTIYLEIDDLLDYLRNHKTVSGIQRVQVGVIAHAINKMEEGRGSYSLVRAGKYGSSLISLLPDDIAIILDYIKQPFVVQSQLVKLIEFAEERATPVEPIKGQVYFVLGAFWGFGSNTARYSRLKRAGVGIGVYIYDLIPITHPEYCHAGTVSEFSFALGDGLHVFDFILTISEYVARSVRDFIARNGLRPVPVEAVPLAHQIHDAPILLSAGAQADLWQGSIAPLKDRPYVLVVCTIEPRKNHMYLYVVWKALVEEGLEPPDLVFVGRFGWRVNDFREMLTDTGFLSGRIHLLHDLSDVDLELLYRSCLFTAFPSIVEGWGLPVGESLAHGRAIVASNASSIPEVGGEFVDYVDPWNVTDGIGVFKRMIFDAAYREQRTKNVRDNFVSRTWDDVSKDLLTRFDSLRRLSGAAYAPPLLNPGELLVPSDMAPGKRTPDNYAQRPLRAIFADGWYQAEPIGVWMRGKYGILRLKTDLAPGTPITAYMQLLGAPWSADHTLTSYIGEKPRTSPVSTLFPASVQPSAGASFPIRSGAVFSSTVSGEVGADGAAQVFFEVHGPDVHSHPARSANDDRLFYVALTKFTYAPVSDFELRAAISEGFARGTV